MTQTNRVLEEKWPWIEAAHGMRAQLLDLLSDADLAFTPGGQNMTLGALYCEMGDTEYSYIQSLKTLKQEWLSSHTAVDVVSSVARLKVWLQTLDDEMKAAITAFEAEGENRPIERGDGTVTLPFQLDVYLQAVLIFLGKGTIYLKAMDRTLPGFFQEYIG